MINIIARHFRSLVRSLRQSGQLRGVLFMQIARLTRGLTWGCEAWHLLYSQDDLEIIELRALFLREIDK
eukprot:48173-Eustigmatos_ZCMA.PRE.1